MSGKRLFLTNSSSLVGSRCLTLALNQNYNVVASVPSPEKANTVRRGFSPAVPPNLLDNLTFVIVPDTALADCFDDFLSEVDYIVHVACPLWSVSDLSDASLQPALTSLLSLLSAAKKSKTVQTVVLCSSLVGLTTDRLFEEGLPFNIINIYPSTALGRSSPAPTTAELLGSSCVAVDELARTHTDVLGLRSEDCQ